MHSDDFVATSLQPSNTTVATLSPTCSCSSSKNDISFQQQNTTINHKKAITFIPSRLIAFKSLSSTFLNATLSGFFIKLFLNKAIGYVVNLWLKISFFIAFPFCNASIYIKFPFIYFHCV